MFLLETLCIDQPLTAWFEKVKELQNPNRLRSSVMFYDNGKSNARFNVWSYPKLQLPKIHASWTDVTKKTFGSKFLSRDSCTARSTSS